MNTDYISIHIQTEKPVELQQFTSTLNAINDNYNAFAKSKGEPSANLYVKEVRKGSLIVELAATVLGIDPPVLTSIIEYVPYIKSLYEELAKPEESKVTIKEAMQLAKICQIPQSDSHATIEMQTIASSGNIINNGTLIINNNSATRTQSAISKLTKDQQQEETVRNKKLLYFDQISKRNLKSSNKGKIDDISPKALSVIFDNEDIQKQIMGSVDNPLQKGHIVDVVVQTVKDEPKVYKIVAYYESVDIE